MDTDSDALKHNVDESGLKPVWNLLPFDDVFAEVSRELGHSVARARAAGVPAEAHVYASGGHGGGIDPIAYPLSEWTRACERWLQDIEPELKRLKHKTPR